jgi:threonine dehydratase
MNSSTSTDVSRGMEITSAALGRADVEQAALWLSSRVQATPVVSSPAIDRIAGARLLLKAENLQLSGSYKVRGAMRAVSRIAAAGSHPGIVAQSTGNHALAVAMAARDYGLRVTVVLPADAAPGKVAKAEAYGATVILAGSTVEERLTVVEQIRASNGYAVVDAYDHPDVVAGQGTASLELIAEARRLGSPLSAIVVPVGGGGGLAGACLAADGEDIAVYGVEPIGCDSMAQSLAAGRRVTVPPAPTLADGLRPSCVGALPFDIARSRVEAVLRVGDDDIARALCLALFHAKLLAEPSAAAALAGALRLAATGAHETIGVLLTGGNAEPVLVSELAAAHASTITTREGTAS